MSGRRLVKGDAQAAFFEAPVRRQQTRRGAKPEQPVADVRRESVLAQLAALDAMSMDELRARWRNLTGADPPPFNRIMLTGRLAYRIREVAFGGLKPATVARLDALARQIDRAAKSGGKLKARAPRDRPVSGTRLIREWQSVEHCVTVRDDGYEYQGRFFKSLSAVARAITGTRWNGWAFFGLRAPCGGSEAAP